MTVIGNSKRQSASSCMTKAKTSSNPVCVLDHRQNMHASETPCVHYPFAWHSIPRWLEASASRQNPLPVRWCSERLTSSKRTMERQVDALYVSTSCVCPAPVPSIHCESQSASLTIFYCTYSRLSSVPYSTCINAASHSNQKVGSA